MKPAVRHEEPGEKRKFLFRLLFMLSLLAAVRSAAAGAPSPAQGDPMTSQWTEQYFSSIDKENFSAFFSFVYNGVAFSRQAAAWAPAHHTRQLDAQRRAHTLVWRDPATGLSVRAEAIEYLDSPTVEWTVRFKNEGAADTPILENIQALDAFFKSPDDTNYMLNYQMGETFYFTNPEDAQACWEPVSVPLGADRPMRFSPRWGRPTSWAWPYFNLQYGQGGALVAVGWPGQWAAQFVNEGPRGVHVTAGQELTRFKLTPGEEVRTPLIVLQFYPDAAAWPHNAWRRWMLDHNLPRTSGQLPEPLFSASGMFQHNCMTSATEQTEKAYIEGAIEHGLQPGVWWMDAGWYTCEHWNFTGNWDVDKRRFPNGIRPVTDLARSHGMKSLLWFEPENATKGTRCRDEHPEWFFGSPDDGWRILNLGNPDARRWITDLILDVMEKEGIEIYRQDFNVLPLESWRRSDAPDRQGITEIRYVEGYLALFDEILARRPGTLIDTCSSGGKRLDLETLRRTVPLWRCDNMLSALYHQAHTYGLALWLPYFGTAVPVTDDPTMARSAMCPATIIGWDLSDPNTNFEFIRNLQAEWRATAHDALGDFYPLLPYSRDERTWMAWQFNDAKKGTGYVMAFRHAQSPFSFAPLKLAGLNPKASYAVKDWNTGQTVAMTGRQLTEQGLRVTLEKTASSALLTYQRMP